MSHEYNIRIIFTIMSLSLLVFLGKYFVNYCLYLTKHVPRKFNDVFSESQLLPETQSQRPCTPEIKIFWSSAPSEPLTSWWEIYHCSPVGGHYLCWGANTEMQNRHVLPCIFRRLVRKKNILWSPHKTHHNNAVISIWKICTSVVFQIGDLKHNRREYIPYGKFVVVIVRFTLHYIHSCYNITKRT